MNGETIKEARRSGCRGMATGAVGVSKKPGMRRAIAPRRKAIDGFPWNVGAECDQERRHQPYTEDDGSSRLDQSRQPWGGSSRTGGKWAADADSSRLAARLHAVRPNPLPTGLRPQETGCEARLLSGHRLHGRAGKPSKRPDRDASGSLATSTKTQSVAPLRDENNANRPTMGRTHTPDATESEWIVPPRDKTP